MVKKIIGYILMILGIVLLFFSLGVFKDKINLDKIGFLSAVKPLYITIVAVVLIGAGIFLVIKFGKSRGKMDDLPVWQGKEMIGYRRTKK